MKILGVALLAVIGLAGWVRLAPSDPARWHVAVNGQQDADFPGGVRRVLMGDRQAFVRLDAIIRATARTRVLAGSVSDGRVTYITRSAVWGFPDYTTVELRTDALVIYGRLRFGRSDFGVNRARVEGWLAALVDGRGQE